jgi:tRNA(Ile)-lysidine synthase
MSLLDRFLSFIKNQHLFAANDQLLLAVSGGVDSVVLCELCKRAGFEFAIAHCNFQLRGEESDRDEAFVKTLGEKYGVKVFTKKFNTQAYAAENKVSMQVAARELRYNWFEELLDFPEAKPGMDFQLRESGITQPVYLLTAHHANDNIETLLMNFFKGTGVTGLRAILPKKGKIIRPFLFAKKEELIEFAEENNLAFVEDSSNFSEKYTRNYIRNQLIPSVQNIFPQVEDNLLQNIERFRGVEVLYRQIVAQHKIYLVVHHGNEDHFPGLVLL